MITFLLNLVRSAYRLVSLATLVGMAALGWSVYQFAWPTTTSAPAAAAPRPLQDAVEDVVRRVPPALPKPERALRPTLVVPLAGDRDGLVQETLERELTAQGWYKTVEPDLVQRAMEALSLANGPVTEVPEALALARRAEAEVVVLGKVTKLAFDESGSDVALRLQAFEVADGRELFAGEFSQVPEESAGADQSAEGTSRQALPIGWVLAILAAAFCWPLAFLPLLRRTAKAESNSLTLAVLVALIGLPLPVLWFLVTPAFGWIGVLIYLVAMVLFGLWCLAVANWVAGWDA